MGGCSRGYAIWRIVAFRSGVRPRCGGRNATVLQDALHRRPNAIHSPTNQIPKHHLNTSIDKCNHHATHVQPSAAAQRVLRHRKPPRPMSRTAFQYLRWTQVASGMRSFQHLAQTHASEFMFALRRSCGMRMLLRAGKSEAETVLAATPLANK